ncbi:MAG TPA: acetyl-CoA carboxylase biotin carboxyl carrier protein subunit [Vicinamibacterales bacterium]|nr:acetyl-CoA carboxylase biotin carboxyl carrier protein subunit [Vicinamibacterales bacterium]
MIFEVAIGERVRTVGVVRKGAVLHVDLDGTIHVVEAQRVGESVLSMLIHRDGATDVPRSVDAAFAHAARTAQPAASGDLDVHLEGRTIPLQISPAGSFGRQKKAGAGGSASGPQRVTAPMPGKVVRVLVAAGDQVTARQGLVVVEAMKMENELRAARDGRVREVAVREGQSVDAGTVLLVVE